MFLGRSPSCFCLFITVGGRLCRIWHGIYAGYRYGLYLLVFYFKVCQVFSSLYAVFSVSFQCIIIIKRNYTLLLYRA